MAGARISLLSLPQHAAAVVCFFLDVFFFFSSSFSLLSTSISSSLSYLFVFLLPSLMPVGRRGRRKDSQDYFDCFRGPFQAFKELCETRNLIDFKLDSYFSSNILEYFRPYNVAPGSEFSFVKDDGLKSSSKKLAHRISSMLLPRRFLLSRFFWLLPLFLSYTYSSFFFIYLCRLAAACSGKKVDISSTVLESLSRRSRNFVRRGIWSSLNLIYTFHPAFWNVFVPYNVAPGSGFSFVEDNGSKSSSKKLAPNVFCPVHETCLHLLFNDVRETTGET